VFIDADHGEAAVRADWAAYAPLCAPGGVVVLHDINPRPDYGVSALWRDLQAAGEVTQEINARAGWPHPCGLGIVYF
jgi:predicted O-methyltransferase YrrM